VRVNSALLGLALATHKKVTLERPAGGQTLLTYYEQSHLMTIKSFIKFGPGANVIKLFCP
jgi:hypothetical protein